MLRSAGAIDRDPVRIDRLRQQGAFEGFQCTLQQVLEVGFHGRDSTATLRVRLKQFERIHIECPAHASDFRQRFDRRYPAVEKAVQGGAFAAFD